MNTWFEVEKQGLATILERRRRKFALFGLRVSSSASSRLLSMTI